MTTNTPVSDDSPKSDSAWWEKLTDSSTDADSGRRLLKNLIVAAVAILVIVAAWKFFDSSKAESNTKRNEILEKALTLLPDPEWSNYGVVGDPFEGQSTRQPQSLASGFLRSHPGVLGKDSVAGPFFDAESADSYRADVEAAIQQLKDNSGEFTDGLWEARYLHLLQQLHFYAAINSTKTADRMRHLDEQLKILENLKANHANVGILGMKPIPSMPEKTVLDLCFEAANAEKNFASKNNLVMELKTDKDLTVTLELDNGKTVEIELYSRIAPMAVANFLAHANGGKYDGTAFHQIDTDTGSLVGGGIYSNTHPDRKYIWGSENPGYQMTSESTELLPTKRGSVCLAMQGATGHGSHFKIVTVDPDVKTSADTVFGVVTKGIEALEEWATTEVHDEPSVASKKLPRVRLGIKKVTVKGTQEHKSNDSWKVPNILEEMKPGAETGAEKSFMEALKKLEEGDKKEEDNKEKENEGN